MTQEELIKGVRKYANDNYGSEGWDFVAECWDDDAILQYAKECATLEEAIARIEEVCSLQDEMREEIESTIW